MTTARKLSMIFPLAIAAVAISIHGARAQGVGASVVDSTTLDAAGIAKLSSSTSISFGVRTLTVQQLRDAHEVRVVRFTKASQLGLQTAAKVVTVPVKLLFSGLGAATTGVTKLGKDLGSVVSVHHSRPAAKALPLLSGVFSGHGFAKDYVDFCTAAKASACIYVPAASYAVYDSTSTTIDDTDFFATQDECAAGAGTWKKGTCHYLYPASSSVQLNTTATAQTQVRSSCIDQTGAFQSGFTGSLSATSFAIAPTLSAAFNAQTQIGATSLISCVTKLFAAGTVSAQ